MMVTPWFGWHTDVTAAVNPPVRLDPARRDDPALWRGYVLDQPRRRLCGFVGTDARVRRRAARHPRVRAARRCQGGQRIQRARQTPRLEERASAGDSPCRDRGAGAVRQPVLPEVRGRASLRGKAPRFSRSCGSMSFAPNTRCASNGTRATSPSGTIARPRTWRRGTFSNPTSTVSFIGSRWWASRWSASMASRPGRSKACRSDRRRRNCG